MLYRISDPDLWYASEEIFADREAVLSRFGSYSNACLDELSKLLSIPVDCLDLMPSGTTALEVACLLAGLGPGDEVICSGYTFFSTYNAILLRGATPVLVDCDPSTMNICIEELKKAVSKRTKAIMVVSYAGISSDLFEVRRIADAAGAMLIEDAAQSIGSTFGSKNIGTFGDFAAFSFGEQKLISCQLGGLLITRNKELVEKKQYILQRGTNRLSFKAGLSLSYEWLDVGTHSGLNEPTAAFLYNQLRKFETIISGTRRNLFQFLDNFKNRAELQCFSPMSVPERCEANGHIFFFHAGHATQAAAISLECKKSGLECVGHYNTPTSFAKGYLLQGEVPNVDRNAATLLRLPTAYQYSERDVNRMVDILREAVNKAPRNQS